MSIDRRAYLCTIRNIRRGLVTRTKILRALDDHEGSPTAELARHVGMSYGTVLYHLRNMMAEEIVVRDKETLAWSIGPFEQAELTAFFERGRPRRRKRA